MNRTLSAAASGALLLSVALAAACGGAAAPTGGTAPDAPESAPAAHDEAARDRTTTRPTETAPDQETHVHTNRLAQESSPYLLQHQHNPVDWYPWGEEAFAKAREEGKPIFLSIGYSTCHWCHVMERESFESEETAKLMNALYVCVKVDREERPDVDAVYMKAIHAMGERGGWPLSMWLTPDGKPFYGGTYFPPQDYANRPSFQRVLISLADAWKNQREKVLGNAEQMVTLLQQAATPPDGVALSKDTLEAAIGQFKAGFDPEHGGFGPAPKFPSSFDYWFLLREHDRALREATGRTDILGMVETTLDHIWRGGIHDHVGGGFHRYSTDREWLVPHFEKMLYDQALLSRAFLEAYQLTGKEHYADAARDIFDYVLRDLRDEGGGFHSAEDADSEGVEGKFYVWTRAEVAEVLGAADAELFDSLYQLTDEGNFVDEAARSRNGTNIPHLRQSLTAHAEERNEDPAAFAGRVAQMRAKLLAVRSKRIRPHLDDKVLTDWNGLMIASLAYGGAALGEPRYTAAAEEAAQFILGTMRKDGVLLHRYRKGDAGIGGFLEDYAFLCFGLVELYQATFDPQYLTAAHELAREMNPRFRAEDDTFELASHDAERLITRSKDLYDGATPSGNSVAAWAQLVIGRLTGDLMLADDGRKTLAAWSGTIARFPRGYTFSLLALAFDLGPTREIVIAGDPEAADTQALLAAVRGRYLPNTVVLLHPTGPDGAAIEAAAPFLKAQGPVDGKAAAYVCEGYACQAPVTSVDALLRLLE